MNEWAVGLELSLPLAMKLLAVAVAALLLAGAEAPQDGAGDDFEAGGEWE